MVLVELVECGAAPAEKGGVVEGLGAAVVVVVVAMGVESGHASDIAVVAARHAHLLLKARQTAR